MSDKSAIEWTDATWNPIRARNLKTGKVGWHCEHATTGCEFCYAEVRNKWIGTGLPFKPGHRKDIEIFLDEETLLQPLRWKKPRMIFPGSMTDLFADFVRDEWLGKIFSVMMLTPHHTYQPLTKRAARMREYMSANKVRDSALRAGAMWPPANVWLGVSAERQQEWDERKEYLRDTPAAIRFASFEPLLGNILEPRPMSDFIQWAIVGGESGPKARPMHPAWPRSLRDQCAAGGVPFFFKQHGDWIDWRQAGAGCWTNTTPQRTSYKGPMVGKLSLAGADLFKGRSFPTKVTYGEDSTTFVHVGKKLAGRFLDGVEYSGMPKTKRPAA